MRTTPLLCRGLACSPQSCVHSTPSLHAGLRTLGKFIFWTEILPWLCLPWAGSGARLFLVVQVSTSPEWYPSLELLGPWVQGLEVLRPLSPLPGQASTPWLSMAAAAEDNAGLAWAQLPCATENCNLASLSKSRGRSPEPHL